ncbi:MAG: CPBP family intramembrane metalloprotease [Candidatus Micrarchaeota archaeon]|nr:CPBP family intramembrane metalloprotease [Candidatus Micrarchaeota archaeon]
MAQLGRSSSLSREKGFSGQKLSPHEAKPFRMDRWKRIASFGLAAGTSYLALHYLQEPTLGKYLLAYFGSFGAAFASLYIKDYYDQKRKIQVTKRANILDWWEYKGKNWPRFQFMVWGSIMEEVLFRGPVVLTKNFEVAWITSTLFGAAHAEDRNWAIKSAYTGFGGGLLASIALHHGLLWAMGVHIVHNVISLVLDGYFKKKNPLTNPYRVLEEFKNTYEGPYKIDVNLATTYMLNRPKVRELLLPLQRALFYPFSEQKNQQLMKEWEELQTLLPSLKNHRLVYEKIYSPELAFYPEIPERVKKEYTLLSHLYEYFPPSSPTSHI